MAEIPVERKRHVSSASGSQRWPGLTLRAPLNSDYAALASWVTDAGVCKRWAGSHVRFPFMADELAGLLDMPQMDRYHSYCLAEGLGEPQAFGQHWVAVAGAVHLGRIMVAPARRGLGLGKLLCQRLMAQAIECTGAQAVTLRVYRDNAAAIHLYALLGFSEVVSESNEDLIFMKIQATEI